MVLLTRMNRVILLAVILLFFSLRLRAQKTAAHHIMTEKEAMNKVMHLSDVRAASAYMQHGKDKRKLIPMSYGEPDRQRPYYTVAVGEDNGMKFVPHFYFYVYLKTGKILYYDIFNDTAIDLQTWRRSRQKKEKNAVRPPPSQLRQTP